FISGQKRGVFGFIKCELRRRSAIESVIGHMKTDGHLGHCFLKGRDGDAHKRHPHRRSQPPPRRRLAEASLAPHSRRSPTSAPAKPYDQIGLLTDDGVGNAPES